MKITTKLYGIFAISLMLLGAFLMFDGQLLGESTTGIARVLGIVGIGLIGSGPRLLKGKNKESSTS
jgi:hypothetical protein